VLGSGICNGVFGNPDFQMTQGMTCGCFRDIIAR
jgi:hypothetical protein